MSTTLDIIRAQYPNRITLSVEELAQLINVSTGRIRKAVCAGRFFIPARRNGNRIMFPVAAVVAVLDGGALPPPKCGPGRPRKVKQLRQDQLSQE